MSMLCPNEGELDEMEIGWPPGTDFRIILFTDNITPDADTVLGDLTVPTFPGYVFSSFTPDAPTTVGGKAMISTGPHSFERTTTGSPQSAYGVAVINNDAGVIRRIERFPAGPYVFTNDGDTLTLNTVTMTLYSEV